MRLTFILCFFSMFTFAQTNSWKTIPLNTNVSFRGISVINDSIAWISGGSGTVGRTTDGGNSLILSKVANYESKDFRSIYAFDSQKAIIANAGSPASILKTENGGLSWQLVYYSNDSDIFIDGVDFWNRQEGLIYGDPLNGMMLVLSTTDGGQKWTNVCDASRPTLRPNESSFAASGTGIRCFAKQHVIISTGGFNTRLYTSCDKGRTWDTIATPMLAGRKTTGIFSVARNPKNRIVIVGGDYLIDTLKTNHVFYSNNDGKTWKAPNKPTRGYRECVEFVGKNRWICVGPGGSDLSIDNGKSWAPLSNEKNFHTLRKARNGKLLIASGKGKVAIVSAF